MRSMYIFFIILLPCLKCQSWPYNISQIRLPAIQYPELPWEQEKSKDDTCALKKNWTRDERCSYVIENAENCDGGGHIKWTYLVECSRSRSSKAIVITGAVLYLIFMFTMMSTVSDRFFSPTIAAIVSHLKINENVAGVTFMAFGNGATEVFGSLASVVGTPNPKAGLALGSTMGSGMFITTIVAAMIIWIKPFAADPFSMIRDILFYLVALGFILFVFLHANQVYLFEPIVFLVLYVVYVLVVIIRQIIHRRSQRKKKKNRSSEASLPDKDESIRTKFGLNIEENEDVVVLHHHVFIRDKDHPLNLTKSSSTVHPEHHIRTGIKDIITHLNPSPTDSEWKEMPWYSKIVEVITMTPLCILKATIPLDEYEWSKWVAYLLALTGPQVVLFAIGVTTWSPYSGSPGLWLYGLGISVILIILISIFTRFDRDPKKYKEFYSYLGFLAAIAWAYILADEIISVAITLGIITNISFEVLGLTLLCWCNSLADAVTDRAVAKQGFPKMAMTAAIGGPVFHFLVGFGLPFTIAIAQGKTVNITFSPVYHFLILFLGISLVTTLFASVIQRFYLRRVHAYVLILIYIIFLVMVVLSETRVIVWD